MKKYLEYWSKLEWKKFLSISGGVLSVMIFCLFINGFHLDSDFEIISHTPAPASEVAIQAQINDNGEPKININTATAEELEDIYGVGDKMAQRIIEHRTSNGRFKQIEDIMKVDGIGKKTFDAMKDMICVE